MTGDPIDTWSAMLAEIFGVLLVPNDPSDALGGASYDGRFECVIYRYRPEPAPALQVGLDMRPVPGDVTGRYSLVVSAVRTEQPSDLGSEPWPGGPAPAPPPARERPGVGEPLAPETVADVRQLAAAYAEQARQFDGATDEWVTTNDDSSVYGFVPVGGAGGYSGQVRGLDADSGPDYIYYELYND